MKATRWLLLTTLLFAALAVACNTPPTPRISNANLGTEVQGGKITNPTTTFAPTDHQIQLVVDLENVLGGTTLGAKWYKLGANGQDQLLFSNDLTLDALNTSGEFGLTSTGDLAKGDYKVVIVLNGKEDRTLNFQVK